TLVSQPLLSLWKRIVASPECSPLQNVSQLPAIARGVIALCLFNEAIELARLAIARYLAVPRVHVILIEPRAQLRQFLRRELGGCFFQLLDGHGMKTPSNFA